MPDLYYAAPLLAHARGIALDAGETPPATLDAALDALDDRARGKFARRPLLPRVTCGLDRLRALSPATVLDVGPGRYTSLWPMMEALPDAAFTVVDPARGDFPGRAPELLRMRRGGLAQLRDAHACTAETLAAHWPVDTFEVATAWEVLEHVDDPLAAARALLHVARMVLVSVPCWPDTNPDHLHLFTHPSIVIPAMLHGSRPTVPLDALWYGAAAHLGVRVRLDVTVVPAKLAPRAPPRHFVATVVKE